MGDDLVDDVPGHSHVAEANNGKQERRPGTIAPTAGPRARDRLAAGLLLAVLAVGSLMLWIGVPAACMWFASRLTDDRTVHLQLSVATSVAGMALFGWLLFRVNRLYVAIVAEAHPPEPEGERDPAQARYVRGPLEPILVGSLLIAVIAITVWFFVLAENPPRRVI